jgi:hypothetical protein
MSRAELSFLLPLFELVGHLSDADDVDDMTMGLGEIDANSVLAGDDHALDGLWVSIVAGNGIGACIDHLIALRDLVLRDGGAITPSAPWTLLRAAVEACSVSAWVLAPPLRKTRRAYALRVWHHDFSERQKWEDDTGQTPPTRGKSGSARAAEVVALASNLGIKPTQVATPLAYSDVVAAGAATVGWDRTESRARWREASAFAHGRTWPLLTLTSPTSAEAIRGGVGVSLTLNEARLEPLARLASDLLNGALLRYAELADAPDGPARGQSAVRA